METVTRYMDLTRRFLKRLLRGNKYLLVSYHFDANHIRAISIKNRKGLTITDAWEQLYNDFKKIGIAPQTYVLDNEKSRDLMNSFDKKKVSYQLVLPYKHRNNQAE